MSPGGAVGSVASTFLFRIAFRAPCALRGPTAVSAMSGIRRPSMLARHSGAPPLRVCAKLASTLRWIHGSLLVVALRAHASGSFDPPFCGVSQNAHRRWRARRLETVRRTNHATGHTLRQPAEAKCDRIRRVSPFPCPPANIMSGACSSNVPQPGSRLRNAGQRIRCGGPATAPISIVRARPLDEGRAAIPAAARYCEAASGNGRP